MQVDYIIIGQGICGTWLSWCLHKKGKQVVVIDELQPYTASRIASGVINPVTGRRIVKTWMIEQLLPFACNAYNDMGNELSAALIRQCNVLDFHTTLQMKEAFETRLTTENNYLKTSADDEKWKNYFRFNYGLGEIAPCLMVDVQTMIDGWRKKLEKNNSLLQEKFAWTDCKIGDDAVTYKDIAAQKIICCEGVAGFDNPYFRMLPYAKDKGEAIIASIPGLPRTNIYKQGLSIVPWKEDLFWIGSTNTWKYADMQPTQMFRKKVEEQLGYWLKLPFTIIDHWAAERPANIERRPFVGLHPVHQAVGVFNGMGTKGCSLAPYFAHEFAGHLTNNTQISAEADIKRFARVLSR